MLYPHMELYVSMLHSCQKIGQSNVTATSTANTTTRKMSMHVGVLGGALLQGWGG